MNALNNATILVVDDEPDLCEMLAFEFRLQGSRVLSASDGDGAFELVRLERVDAVITDLQMAHGNGIELLDRIRDRHACEPPVLFITAYDTALSPADAYDRGADGIFGKPFKLKDLIDKVERVLTEPQRRWAERIDGRLFRLVREYGSVDEARDRGEAELGRGGIALSLWGGAIGEQLEPGRLIGLDIRFRGGPVCAVAGAGTVRWLAEDRNGPAACGIEFEYLDACCRQAVIDWLAGNGGRSFIPRLSC